MYGDIHLAGDRWRIEPSLFSWPDEVHQTSNPDDVQATLIAAERSALRGLWVVGYISYQSAPGMNPRLRVPGEAKMPLVWFGAYGSKDDPREDPSRSFLTEGWTADISEEEYESKFAMVKQAISAGLTYQVNLTFPMRAEFEGDFSGLFASMLRAQPNSYAATIDLDPMKVASASPELFLATEGRRMRTKPIDRLSVEKRVLLRTVDGVAGIRLRS